MRIVNKLLLVGLCAIFIGCDSGKKVVVATGTLPTPDPKDLVSSGGGGGAATGGGADTPTGK